MTQIGATRRSTSFQPAAIGGFLLAGALLLGIGAFLLASGAGSATTPAVPAIPAAQAAEPVMNRLDSEYLRSIAVTWGDAPAIPAAPAAEPVMNRLDSEYLRSIATGW